MENLEQWKNGERITAERLNRMQELAAKAQDTAQNAQLEEQIKELRLLCDEQGKLWGAAIRSAQGEDLIVPAVRLTFTPITFAPTTFPPITFAPVDAQAEEEAKRESQG